MMNEKMRQKSKIAKALSAECRLLLLGWLNEPDHHFNDRLKLKGRRNAVAAPSIQQKWNVSDSTTKKHIWLLKVAGLVTVERHSRIHWVIRSSKGIAAARRAGHIYVR